MISMTPTTRGRTCEGAGRRSDARKGYAIELVVLLGITNGTVHAQSASRDPNVNSALNPNINSSFNPNINSSINPMINSSLNPNINSSINPRINSSLNPNINSSINPQ